jgi:hypothetical protein
MFNNLVGAKVNKILIIINQIKKLSKINQQLINHNNRKLVIWNNCNKNIKIFYNIQLIAILLILEPMLEEISNPFRKVKVKV